jgi:Phytanoyl-CoA dioxygenase (PhyH)
MPVKLSFPPLAPIGSDPSTFDYQCQHLTLLSHIRAVARQYRLLPRKPTGVVRCPSPLSAGKAGLDGRRFDEAMSIVTVSADERVTGQLTEENAHQAYRCLDAEGFVVLRGCFAPYTVDEMYREYQAQYGHLNLAEMEELARGPGAVMSVGNSRFEMVMRLAGAFDARVYANPVLLRFLAPLIGQDMRLSGVSAVAAYPGADRQHVHRDAGHLFADYRVGPTLPTYAINVAVPLIDVDHTIGPTAIWPGHPSLHRRHRGHKRHAAHRAHVPARRCHSDRLPHPARRSAQHESDRAADPVPRLCTQLVLRRPQPHASLATRYAVGDV